MTICEKINSFSRLKKNWGGYGTLPIEKDIIDNALRLEKYLYYKDGASLPVVSALELGSIIFEYKDNENYLGVEVRKICYNIYKVVGKQKYHYIVPLNKVYEVVNIIKLFFNPKTDRMCLFTGAFNPCTIAHYHMIESANDAGHFDYIVFAVSNQKFLDKKQARKKDFAYSEDERLEMILAMTYKCPNVLIFGVEEGYTYDVLCAVKEKYQCSSLYFALGSDKLREIGRWGHHDKLLKEICFYILQRNDSMEVIEKKCKELFSQTKYIIGHDNKEFKNISATQIRERMRNHKDYSELVCKEVYNILQTIT